MTIHSQFREKGTSAYPVNDFAHSLDGRDRLHRRATVARVAKCWASGALCNSASRGTPILRCANDGSSQCQRPRPRKPKRDDERRRGCLLPGSLSYLTGCLGGLSMRVNGSLWRNVAHEAVVAKVCEGKATVRRILYDDENQPNVPRANTRGYYTGTSRCDRQCCQRATHGRRWRRWCHSPRWGTDHRGGMQRNPRQAGWLSNGSSRNHDGGQSSREARHPRCGADLAGRNCR